MPSKQSNQLYAVTGATGKLGQLAITALLKTTPPAQIVALARTPEKASALAAQGVVVREADYDRPETLRAALTGVNKLLFIASNKIGGRVPQHRAVIDAAREADVELIAYTSVLHSDVTRLNVGEEHRQTEALLKASGVPHVLLRNGWYTENYTLFLAAILQHGAVLGSTGEGRIASAARVDYAEAAVSVLKSQEVQAGRIYELAGDTSWTLADLAAEISQQSGTKVWYRDLPEPEYKAALVSDGLPEHVAASFARSSAVAKDGELFDTGHQLSGLINRPTTPMKETVAIALKTKK